MILLVAVGFTIFASNSVFSQTNSDGNITSKEAETITHKKNLSDGPAIQVGTERIRYIPGEVVLLGGAVFDREGHAVDAKVSLAVEFTNAENKTPKLAYKISLISFGDSGFQDRGLNLESSGHYTITATTIIDGKEETAFDTFEVIDYYNTIPFFMVCVGVAAFTGLSIIIMKGAHIRPVHRELLRFVFITVLVSVPVVVFILTDVQIGQTAPVGLVVKPPQVEVAPGEKVKADWMINVGGSWADNYRGGIQIPVFVFLFGLGGGYIRYLRYMYKELWADSGSPADDEKDKIQRDVFRRSMKDIALLFLSPLLAITVYFMLFTVGINTDTNLFTIATLCFAVGLITDNIIKRIEKFAGAAIGADREDLMMIRKKIVSQIKGETIRKNTDKNKKETYGFKTIDEG